MRAMLKLSEKLQKNDTQNGKKYSGIGKIVNG
jgi:hypothetical protein